MLVRDKSIDLQLIKAVKGKTNNKGRMLLVNLQKLLNAELNVPYADTCCVGSEIPLGSPTRVFEGVLEYHDGTSWVAAPGGDPGGFTPGSVIFASGGGTLTEDNPNLFYDDANNRLGIGTNSPQAPLHVVGSKAIIDNIDIFSKGTFTGAISFTDGLGNNTVTNDESHTAIGYRASLNQNGVFCTSVGIRSQESPTGVVNQAHNTSVGAYSLRNINQFGNTAMGSCAAYAMSGFYRCTAIGAFAMTKTAAIGTNGVDPRGITAIGYLAIGGTANCGEWTTAVGNEAGYAFNGGSVNTAVGAFSMGSGSTILGGAANLTGTENTGVGAVSLFALTTGSRNTALGTSAGRNHTTGTTNLFVGYTSGINLITGDYNVVIGSNSGATISGLNNHILISDGQGNQRLLINNLGAYSIGGGYGAAGEVLTSNGNAASPSWQAVPAGTSSSYLPTLTNVTNVTASTAYTCSYYQVGLVVTVMGRVNITPTAGAWADTLLRMDLPVGTGFTNKWEAGGTASAINIQGNNGNSAGISAEASGSTVEFAWKANDTTVHDFYFNFSYQVTPP